MLTTRRRSGFTLAELLIVLTCGGVVYAVAASIALRQQRLFAELADDAATTGRLREVVATLPIDLRAASPAAGDIRDARDTSLEIRAIVASAVVCDTAGRSLVTGPALAGAETYAAYLTSVAAGDTAWLLDVRDSTERWIPRRVTSVSSATAARCTAGAPMPRSTPFGVAVIALDTLAPARAGTVFRVTRPIRYSLYRASDGSWQLGVRDWNTTAQRLNSVQPVAGPLLPVRGLAISYFDSMGVSVANPADSLSGIALIRIAARTQSLRPARVLGAGAAAGGAAPRADSLDAAVFLRNRR